MINGIALMVIAMENRSDEMNFETNFIFFVNVCDFFDKIPDKVSSYLNDKFVLKNNRIKFCIVVRLIQKAIIDDVVSVAIVKRVEMSSEKIDSFKIVEEISLNPAKNSINRGEKIDNEKGYNDRIRNIIKFTKSYNQMICLSFEDEIMNGPGDYSVVLCHKSKDEIMRNNKYLNTEVLDDCPFTVVEE